MNVFEIYFNDLSETCQQDLLEKYGIKSPKEMNWDVFPVTVIEIDKNLIADPIEDTWE